MKFLEVPRGWPPDIIGHEGRLGPRRRRIDPSPGFCYNSVQIPAPTWYLAGPDCRSSTRYSTWRIPFMAKANSAPASYSPPPVGPAGPLDQRTRDIIGVGLFFVTVAGFYCLYGHSEPGLLAQLR